MCALLLLVISVFVIRFGRNQRYLPVGWFWFVGTLIPVIGIVQVGLQCLCRPLYLYPVYRPFHNDCMGSAAASFKMAATKNRSRRIDGNCADDPWNMRPSAGKLLE